MRFPGAVATLVLATPAAASEGAGGEGSILITPQFGLIFWTVVTFVILLVLLKRVAWKPLLGAIEARERSVRETIDSAKQERETAAALLEEHKELLAQARRERSEAMAAGQKEAERLKAEILDEARRQKEDLLKQAEGQIQSAVRQARAELRTTAADAAISAAGKLLSRNLDDAAHRRLVDEHLADLERFRAGRPVPS